MKKRNITITFILLAIITGVTTYYLTRYFRYAKESIPPAVNLETLVTAIKPTKLSTKDQDSALIPRDIPAKNIPKELNIAMQFYSQAPFVDWSEPWQNACEEASILLVANAYNHHNWTREEFRDQILALVEWENKNFGDYKSTNAKQILRMLNDVFKLKGIIHQNPNLADVQNILAQGHLIVMTFDGRKLGNPFFSGGGPDYHSLVIKGYKADNKVITEDVGTQHGENYVYDWETLTNANHDWTVPIENGSKLLIEILPPENK